MMLETNSTAAASTTIANLSQTAATQLTSSSASSTTVSASTTSSKSTAAASAPPLPPPTTTATTSAQPQQTQKPAQPTLNALNESRWLFSPDAIENTPSRLDGMSIEQELNERQEAALFISDLGAQLKVNQLCINTAIIYMHRFYMIHSLKKFHRYVRMVATACLFLACKVEEQPRRLREFIDAIQRLFHRSSSDVQNPEEFRKNGEEIVALESCLLQTLGFNVLVQHAHTVIIKTCQMIKATRDLAEAAYLTATNSLILTNFCVKFSSEKIACFCIYLACKWTGLIIPTSSEGRQWYQYVKADIVEQELEDISKEYLTIYDKCLPKIQKKLGKTKNVDSTTTPNAESAVASKKVTPNTMVAAPASSNGQPNMVKHNQQYYHQQQQMKRPPPQPHAASLNDSHTQPHHKNIYVNTNQQPNKLIQQQQKQSLQKPHNNNYPAQQFKPYIPGSNNQRPNQQIQQQPAAPQPKINNSQPVKSQQQQQQQIKQSSSLQNQAHQQHQMNTSINNGQQAKFESNSNNNNSNSQIQNGSANSALPSAHKQEKQPNSSRPVPNAPVTTSASTSTTATMPNTSSGIKRGNEDISAAPNKIPKYILDQKSAS